MKKLRDYQIENSVKAASILNEFKLVYLAFEVRTGKSLTALETAKLYGAKKVLFLTKKKAVTSIQNDYNDFGYLFDLTVINNESLHIVKENDFDLLICDEMHRVGGSFPKPSNKAKDIKKRFSKLPMIFLSGTPTPESRSQWYHQFWVSDYSPFKNYINFYKWSKDFVNVKVKYIAYGTCNDYSDAKENLINENINHLVLTYTQKQAGFETEVKENIIEVEMLPITYSLIKRLKKDLVIISPSGKEIIADSAVKLQSKHLQMASGTIKFEDGTTKVLDYSKAEYIKQNFIGKKLGIFYKFKEELQMLKDVFCDQLTTSINEFDNSDKNIALQFISGREGISLKNADYLIALNIDFSATTYFQFKDRMSTIDRKENTMYWLFSKDKPDLKSIEKEVYQAVINKKSFTTSIYNRSFGK